MVPSSAKALFGSDCVSQTHIVEEDVPSRERTKVDAQFSSIALVLLFCRVSKSNLHPMRINFVDLSPRSFNQKHRFFAFMTLLFSGH